MKPINTIATQWELFKLSCIEDHASATREELEHWRALFYGGAAALLHAIASVPPAERDSQIDAIKEELGGFARDVREQHPGGHLPTPRRR